MATIMLFCRQGKESIIEEWIPVHIDPHEAYGQARLLVRGLTVLLEKRRGEGRDAATLARLEERLALACENLDVLAQALPDGVDR